MLIGICGKSGSGKSTLANEIIKIYQEKCLHLDIDKIGHHVLTLDSTKKELVKFFGNNVLKDDIVDRKFLGAIVFNSPKEMDKLTDITWEAMQKEIDNYIKVNKNRTIILDWLLLPKSKYFKECKLKILIDIPYEIRKDRAIKRDNISEEAFSLREKASYKYNENEFDIVIKNNTTEEYERVFGLL